jgi:hypothetical protein
MPTKITQVKKVQAGCGFATTEVLLGRTTTFRSDNLFAAD